MAAAARRIVVQLKASNAMEEIKVSRVGATDVIELHRPGAGNRITQNMGEQLVRALEAARRDPAVAGCVLTGHGDVFCLGGDYRGAGTEVSGRMEFARAHIDLFDAMARLGKPLVAAINGAAHAGGFSLVIQCDLAFMAEDATIGLPEAAHGLFPFLAMAIARDALPKKLLFDIVYNARLLTASEARELHLVNQVLRRENVVSAAIAAVEAAVRGKPEILMLGRDLYYSMSGLGREAALHQARFALGSALSAFGSDK